MNGYILNGKVPIKCNDLMEVAKQMEGKNRIVEQSQFGDIKVSTIFLGLDHSFGDGEPLLFETMIFGGKNNGYQERYSTWDEAVEGHKKACKLVSLVGHDTLLAAVKNRQLKEWFYYFQYGHPFLLKEEADIIVETRLNDRASKWMNDSQIQKLIKLRVKAMYKRKYPDAKRWSLACFLLII